MTEATRGASPVLRTLLAAQCAIIVVLGLQLRSAGGPDAAYVTRGGTGAAAGETERILVDFDGAVTVSELHRTLRTLRARIVDGPTETGACILELPGGTSPAALTALRAQRGVRLAESLGPGRSQ